MNYTLLIRKINTNKSKKMFKSKIKKIIMKYILIINWIDT